MYYKKDRHAVENVTGILSMGKNAHTVTERDDEEKEKGKANVTEETYHDDIFFGNDALAWEYETINKEIEQIFVADSRSTSQMVNSLKNTTNLREVKTVFKTRNKKMMVGSLWGDWKG